MTPVPISHLGTKLSSTILLLFGLRVISLKESDFVFPAVGTGGTLKPGEPLTHDMVMKWIAEATSGAGISGYFATHSFRRGGAQFWFMYAPIGEWWTLARVRWWGA